MADGAHPAALRVVSFNIGLKGLHKTLEETACGSLARLLELLRADVLCLQETKHAAATLREPAAIAAGYTSFFSANRASDAYAGVATVACSRLPTLAVCEGLTGCLRGAAAASATVCRLRQSPRRPVGRERPPRKARAIPRSIAWVAALCCAAPACVAFTLNAGGTDCYLKSAYSSPPRANAGAVSGVVRGPLPPASPSASPRPAPPAAGFLDAVADCGRCAPGGSHRRRGDRDADRAD